MTYDSYLEQSGDLTRVLSIERKEKRKNTRPLANYYTQKVEQGMRQNSSRGLLMLNSQEMGEVV